MKRLQIIMLLLVFMIPMASYAENRSVDTTQSEVVCVPFPIKALSAFLKPYIKKAVQELVKKGIVNKANGVKLKKLLIQYTTEESLRLLVREQLTIDNYVSWTANIVQTGHTSFIMNDDISTQAQNNMKIYLERYKEEHQTDESIYNCY